MYNFLQQRLLSNEARITAIVSVIAAVVFVVFLVYYSPAESNASNDDNVFEEIEPYWTKPIDNMKENVIESYVPPAPSLSP